MLIVYLLEVTDLAGIAYVHLCFVVLVEWSIAGTPQQVQGEISRLTTLLKTLKAGDKVASKMRAASSDPLGTLLKAIRAWRVQRQQVIVAELHRLKTLKA
jgi:hypothetical protein